MGQPKCKDCNKHYVDCNCVKHPDVSESDSNALLYFVYAEKDPRCSCCQWEYIFCEYEEEAEAREAAKKHEKDGYYVHIIKGTELEI
jgi:hypothetical protein